VSAQKRALVDLAVRTRLYVDHCDAFLMEQPSLILKRRKTVLPICCSGSSWRTRSRGRFPCLG